MEEVFDLQVCILKILRAWRFIVVVMIVCGLLAGALRVYQGLDILVTGERLVPVELSDEEQAAYTKQVQEYKAALTDYNNKLAAYQKAMDAMKLNNGPIQAIKENMATIQQQIDAADAKVALFGETTPESSYRLTRSVMVSLPEGSKVSTAQIVLEYLPEMTGSGICTVLSQTRGQDISAAALPGFFTIGNSGNVTLVLAVMGDSPEYCQKAMDASVSLLLGKHAAVEAVTGPHELKIIESNEAPAVDPTFYNAKLAATREANAVRNELANTQKSLDTLMVEPQKPAELELTEPEPPEDAATRHLGRGSVVSGSIQYCGMGLVGGMVLGIILTLFFDVMSQSIQSEQDFRRRTGIPVLGAIPLKRGK